MLHRHQDYGFYRVNLRKCTAIILMYFYMHWFRQKQEDLIKLIAFTTINQNPDFGEFSEDKYSAEKTVAERGSFTVKKLQPDDSGVYFCE